MKRLMCLRLPHWPIQRVLAERPELRAGPVLLLRQDPRRGAVVVAGCSRARAAGIRADMSLADATGLLPPATVTRPYDPVADRSSLGRLAKHCEQFSPRVGWETVGKMTNDEMPNDERKLRSSFVIPHHLFLDITGLGHLFGGEVALAERVITSCRRLGYAGRAAIAGTLGAAWAITTSGDSVTVVPAGGLLPALRPLSVETLRLPAETVDVLTRLGIGTIDDLLRLPRAGLATRFGPPLLARLDQAIGTAPEMLVPHRPLPVFEATLELDIPTNRRVDLDWILDGLIDRVTTDLHTHRRGAVRVRVEFRCGADVVRIEVGLYRPTDLAKPLRELVRLHCDRLNLPGPVDRVRLWADQTIRLRPRQEKLFPDPAAIGDVYIAQLIERLSSRLGATAVVRPVFQADPLPERGVRYVPLVFRASRERQRPEVLSLRRTPVADAPGSPHHDVSHRPLRLLNPPIRIAIEGAGPPTAICWQGWHTVARCWGPERIETGWWRGGIVRRDYYRVETATGRRFWLFRDLVGGGWFLHGSFE